MTLASSFAILALSIGLVAGGHVRFVFFPEVEGDNVLAKFFDRNGPKGWYSQPCTSRALQSLNSVRPSTCSSASAMGMGSPIALGRDTTTPSSSS